MANKKKLWTDKTEEIKPAMLWLKVNPSEIIAIDKLIEVYGANGRAGMVRKIIGHFLGLDDDEQRKVLVAEELFRKKAEALLAKQKAEKELEQLEADIKRIGCTEEKP